MLLGCCGLLFLRELPPRTACHFGKHRKRPQPGQNTDENSLKQALTLCKCPKFPVGEKEIRRRARFRARRCRDERRLRADLAAQTLEWVPSQPLRAPARATSCSLQLRNGDEAVPDSVDH